MGCGFGSTNSIYLVCISTQHYTAGKNLDTSEQIVVAYKYGEMLCVDTFSVALAGGNRIYAFLFFCFVSDTLMTYSSW
jgi:hypothetical protein